MKNIEKKLKELNFKKIKHGKFNYYYKIINQNSITFDCETRVFELGRIILNITKLSQLKSLIEIL